MAAALQEHRCSASWIAAACVNLRIGSGSRDAKSGTFDPLRNLRLRQRLLRRALGVDHRLFVFDLLPLEALLAEPVTSKLSRYWRAVSNRLRVTSATTSEPLILNVAVSTANGLLYFLIRSSRMRPEP